MIEASALWNQPLTSVVCVLEQINSLRSERHYRHATGEFRTVGISKRRSDQCRPEQEVPLQGTIPLSMSPWAVANIGAVFLELTQMCTSIPVDAANLTIDSRTDTGNPGVLTVITEGPVARQIGKLTADERKKAVLDAVAERFGDKALSPVDYLEQNWAIERYSGGAMISHTPPGVLTEFGPALREPCGRIHWAGTETSAKMYGFIDGPSAPASVSRPR